MSDDSVFARFIVEMQALLTAIESHGLGLSAEAPGGVQAVDLREIARLSTAASGLAQAFEVVDMTLVAATLAEAATHAADAPDASDDVMALVGARDAVAYLRRRTQLLAAIGRVEAATTREERLAERIASALRDQMASLTAAATVAEVTPDTSDLSLEERAIIESFSSAHLRARDQAADTRLLAQMSESPAFVAQTLSGAPLPIYGGKTAEELDQVPDDMKREFIAEIPADLRELGQLAMELENKPGDAHIVEQVGFLAHKIKGGAAMMELRSLADIATLFDDVVKRAETTTLAAHPAFLPGVGGFINLLEQALAAEERFEEPAPALVAEAQRLHDALVDAEAPHMPAQMDGASEAGRSGAPGAEHELVLRVEARKLDILMNQLSALAVNRGAVARNRSEIARAQAEMMAALARLRDNSAQITDAHPLTYDNLLSVAQSAQPTQTSLEGLRQSWNSLQLEQYTDVDTALRAMAEVVADITANYGSLTSLLDRLGQLTEAQETLTRDIQDDAMSIRLAPFAEIAPRLHVNAMVSAAQMGKQINVDVRGEQVEIDRLLLEKLEQPLIQLVRNAVAHGIEAPAERAALGKPQKGSVWIHAYNVGSAAVIEVGDDGRGVNADLLVQAAIREQLITPDEALTLSHEQALNYMFQSRVSTAAATLAGYSGALAGSGVGLADVASTVQRLKGSITMRGDLGKGTTFQIRVPISLSMLPVLEVRAAAQVFALPFALVEYSAMIEPERMRPVDHGQTERATALREWSVTVDPPLRPATAVAIESPEAVPRDGLAEVRAWALAEALGFEQDLAKLRRIVVLRVGDQSVGLLVESVVDGDVREVTVRPLPHQLQRRAVRGMIVRPDDGQVALLIDPLEALRQRLIGADITLRPARAATTARATAPWVMIVDDSVTIRRTVEQTLTQAGFTTTQARDGREALEMMELELPRVIILDVEMPRLSGFELLTIMCESPRFKQVRVVMLTSRAADKHREHALALGADAYLVKPCPQDILVETIRRLLTDSEPG